MVANVDDAVKRIEAAFWRRYHANPDLRERLKGKHRVVQLDLTDGDGRVFHIVDGKIDRVETTRHPHPDVVIALTSHDLLALFRGDLKPMQAYLSKRIRVRASFADLLFAKSLLGW